jgi:NADP-dependent 3-hydroxy acid dehydrogenase YdfG
MSSTTDGSAPLQGRTAVVTGASRGIGRECARSLHGAGARLVLLGRDMDALTRLCNDLVASERRPVTAFGVQLSFGDSVDRVVRQIREHLGAVPDIIVNNAGTFMVAPIEETEVDDFERSLRVNLISPFAIAHAFVGGMKERGSGHIVTIGSIADRHAFAGNAAYAASKFGARGLHEVMREELRGTGVRTTLVSPGPVDTSLWDEVDPDTKPGFTPRAAMLRAAAVAHAVRYAVTCPAEVNVDELRLSRA